MVRGAQAAAVTPLREGGEALDEDAFGPLVDFLADGGVDGVFALGTTGEGLLLSVGERRRAAELFASACGDRLGLIVHCGAQTTADTVALCAHASKLGLDGIAVVAPPYFAFDDDALVAHFAAAARAAAPTPFYLYEFEARVGYAIPVPVVERLREVASNFAGLKVSDRPFDRFSAYLVEGLDVFVGPEALIVEGLERGAAGAVSGLASAFPDVVSALVKSPNQDDGARVGLLREGLQRFPFHAALKRILELRGVPVAGHVRAPLRQLTDAERAELDGTAERWLESLSPARAP